MGVHYRSEKYFTSPELFMPERWLRGGAADSVHPYILTPFGFGTRTCAGKLNLYSLTFNLNAKLKVNVPPDEKI